MNNEVLKDMEQNNSQEINTNRRNWIAALIISTAYLAVMANIQGFKALLPMVQEEFLISRAEAGLYSSFYFLSATLLAVFSGRIVDWLGAKKSLVLGTTMVGIIIVLHSFAPLFSFILFMAFLTGICFSVLTPAVSKGILLNVKPSRKGFFMGIAHSGGGVGAFAGASLLPIMGEIFDWRIALLGAGTFAILIGLFILKFHREPSSPEPEDESTSGENKTSSFKDDLLHFIKNRYLLSICSMGIVFGMSISSITGHFSLYLTLDLGFTPALAGLGLGIAHLGGVTGHPVWGIINEVLFKGDRRKGLCLLGICIACLAIFFGLVISPFSLPFWIVLVFSFLLGFCTMGAMALFFTSVGELVASEHIGVVTGIALIFTRIGVVIAPPVFGLVADQTETYALSWLLLGSIVLIFTFAFNYFSNKYFPHKNTR